MARHIGITGNIGAGKTTVCREFERLGVPVYYADARAKALMQTDPELRQSITNSFGPEAYRNDGTLDRSWLAARVFEDAAALEKLNGIVHPAVARDATDWQRRQNHPYTLHEAAIIYEIGSADAYHGVIVVHCPRPIRERRVRNRDGIDGAAFAARADKQWTDERKRLAADYLVVNDGKTLLLPQVLRLDRRLRE